MFSPAKLNKSTTKASTCFACRVAKLRPIRSTRKRMTWTRHLLEEKVVVALTKAQNNGDVRHAGGAGLALLAAVQQDQVVEKFAHHYEALLGHGGVLVLEGPDERHDVGAQPLAGQQQHALEAALGALLQHLVKVLAVLGEAVEVHLHHVQSAVEDLLEDLREHGGPVVAQLLNQRRHQRYHLVVPGLGHGVAVGDENGGRDGGHELLQHLVVVGSGAVVQGLHVDGLVIEGAAGGSRGGSVSQRARELVGEVRDVGLQQVDDGTLDQVHQVDVVVFQTARAGGLDGVLDVAGVDVVQVRHPGVYHHHLLGVREAGAFSHAVVHAQVLDDGAGGLHAVDGEALQLPPDVGVGGENLGVGGLADYLVPLGVAAVHQLVDEALARRHLHGGNDVAHGLVVPENQLVVQDIGHGVAQLDQLADVGNLV
ncbi:formyl-CoA transferase [Babesia caballi]|uniref:Formyl-CoA transferase n=1 Tax=Babesia caballi TaxID=5871 RepID=A0AAV4LZ11_BABCB|nr:formyl-CoA transferase [Babesia caballi]